MGITSKDCKELFDMTIEDAPVGLIELLNRNSRINYYGRIDALFNDCESLRECRKDYWTHNHYATMLEHAAFKLRRQAEHVKEDMKHGKK